MGYTFRRDERLHLQKDFRRVMRSGRRLAHPAFILYVFPRSDGSPLRRLGLVTSRKVGKAVARNRIKRRLREIFRLHKRRILPGTDLIFVLRSGAVSFDYASLEAAVLAQLQRAGAAGEEA